MDTLNPKPVYKGWKLTSAQKAEIRKLYKQGVSSKELAKMFGISMVTVCYHARKKRKYHKKVKTGFTTRVVKPAELVIGNTGLVVMSATDFNELKAILGRAKEFPSV